MRNRDEGVKITNANANWVRFKRITYARESCRINFYLYYLNRIDVHGSKYAKNGDVEIYIIRLFRMY